MAGNSTQSRQELKLAVTEVRITGAQELLHRIQAGGSQSGRGTAAAATAAAHLQAGGQPPCPSLDLCSERMANCVELLHLLMQHRP